MGTTIVFVYVAIAAVAAPALWLAWWAADSLGANRAAAPPAGSNPRRAAKARDAGPTVADLTLPGHRGAITLYTAAGAELGTCEGPDHGGRCPRRHADGTVPCAGCMLALPRPIRGSLEWQIPSGYRTCLVGSYGVFRQPAT